MDAIIIYMLIINAVLLVFNLTWLIANFISGRKNKKVSSNNNMDNDMKKEQLEQKESPIEYSPIDSMTFEKLYEKISEQTKADYIEKFLIEMGAGFAFMGRQYHIEVSGDDYYIDILMYNVFLHRYFVIELKDTDLKPEYIGKLNFYCSAVDDLLRHDGDNRTIGLLLCRNKNRIKAEYALRDIEKPIGISEYELGQALPEDFKSSLPSIEEIEKEFETSE